MNIAEWWQTKGVQLFNQRVINLDFELLGEVPITNLFSEEEIQGYAPDDFRTIKDILTSDGLRLNFVVYSDGEKELRCLVKQ